MVATFSVAAPIAYYRQAIRYYQGASNSKAVWHSPSNLFGIIDGAPVDMDDLSRLFHGRNESGRSLGNGGGKALDRVAALDFTFSAPKSVSIAWAFSDDALRYSIERAHMAAVKDALEMLEKRASFARRGKGGQRIEAVQIIAALFQHTDSRPSEHADGAVFADMGLHTHAVIPNYAPRSDGTYGALHSKVLRRYKMAAGAVYHASLASRMAGLGFKPDRIGHNGVFELEGIDPTTISYFSGRRNEIAEELQYAAVRSAATAASIAKRTRRSKLSNTGATNIEAWRDAARRIGLEFIDLVKRLVRRGVGEDSRLYKQRLETLPMRATETESVFDDAELIRVAHADLVGTGLGISHAQEAIEDLKATGMILKLGTDPLGFPQFSTKEMVKVERDVVAMAAQLATPGHFGLNASSVNQLAIDAGLSDEQTAAAIDATRSSALVVIEGSPGSGKSHTARTIAEAYKQAGYKVLGAATAWRIAKQVGGDLHVESRATASWLAQLDRGRKVFDEKTVLFVDEAGLLGARDIHRLLAEAQRAGAKLILAGDRNQLQAINAGSGLDLVARAVIPSRILKIVRQVDEWARTAVTDMGQGRADIALAAFAERDLLVFCPTQSSAIARVVEERRRLIEAGHEALVLARTNAQLAELSRKIRADRRLHGEIGTIEVSVDARNATGHTTTIEISVGDPIRFMVKDNALAVVNGTVGRVVAVHLGADPLSTALKVDLGDRTVDFPLRQLADETSHVHLSLAYGTTIFSAQGLTVDHALVLVDAGFDRHSSFVATSRARCSTRLVVDGKSVDESGDIDAPVAGALAIDQRRRLTLAKCLKRRHVKRSTFEFTAHFDQQGENVPRVADPIPDLSAPSPDLEL